MEFLKLTATQRMASMYNRKTTDCPEGTDYAILGRRLERSLKQSKCHCHPDAILEVQEVEQSNQKSGLYRNQLF